MTATPTTIPTTVPAIVLPFIDPEFMGTAVAELLAATPVPEVDSSTVVDVLVVEVVNGS